MIVQTIARAIDPQPETNVTAICAFMPSRSTVIHIYVVIVDFNSDEYFYLVVLQFDRLVFLQQTHIASDF